MLITLPDGSHRFVEADQGIGQDLDELLNPRRSQPPVRGMGPAKWQVWQLDRHLYGFRVTVEDNRGPVRQRGTFEDLHCMAEGDLVGDAPGIARAPFQTVTSVAPQPNLPLGDRLWGANFLNTDLMIMPEQTGTRQLFKDIGTYSEPAISTVAGFSYPAGANSAQSMEAVQVNAAPALLIGYDTAAVNALQVLTDLANPPTSSSVPVGAGECVGMAQTEVDGNSVHVYTADTNGGLIKVFNTNVALGSVTVSNRTRLPRWGYTLGVLNLGGNPEVFHVVPINGKRFYNSMGVPAVWNDPWDFKGKIVRTDLRALGISDFTVKHSAYVYYATPIGKQQILYCDRTSHGHVGPGFDIPVGADFDWPLSGNRKRVCCGHWRKGSKAYILWNEVSTTAPLAATTAYVMEYDTQLGTLRQVSETLTLGGTGLLSNGSPLMPWSQLNDFIFHSTYAGFGPWWYQYQPPRGLLGYNQRTVAGAPVGWGQRFPAHTYYMSPKMRVPEHPGAVMMVRRVYGPPRDSIRTGGDDTVANASQDAYMAVTCTNTPPAYFYASEPDNLNYHVDFPDNESWFSELQIRVDAYRSTTSGSNSGRYTVNPWPVTVEGFFIEDATFADASEWPDSRTIRDMARLGA